MATATKSAGEYRLNIDDGPDHCLVQVSDSAGGLLVIVAAGSHGRYSLDVEMSHSGLVVDQAYEEGMCCPVDELPDWMASVQEEIETRLAR